MGFDACRDDFRLWEKRNKRDKLSIEIQIDVLRLAHGIVSFYYNSVAVLFLTWRFSRRYPIEACVACHAWGKCVPQLYDGYLSILQKMKTVQEISLGAPSIIRIPFLFPLITKWLGNLIDLLSDRVEDLAFVKDEKSRSSLNELIQTCAAAGSSFDDWRESMDFLH
jgi:hypothetical protein